MRYFYSFLKVSALILLFVAVAIGQETTGGLQGVVKDATGAVVPNAHVVVAGSSLVGGKAIDTDGSGYYRFANLPPGSYILTVTAKGFKTIKQEGVTIEVGHLPTIDLTLEVGSASTMVEVTAAAPVIDVTTTNTISNVTQDVIQEVPHGLSYQSVIQFAPAARNEPLAGNNNFMGGGTGGSSVSSSSNGQAYGYSVAGAADNENSYLVEGQDTSNIAAGYSMANVPFDFIQEVQVKSSGMEAEHGGSMGGVVNVVMKKGSNAFHGQLAMQLDSDKADAAPNLFPRYDPSSPGAGSQQVDGLAQTYQPIKDHYNILNVGGNIGGAIVKDRLFFFAGFEPQLNSLRRNVNWFNGASGEVPFNQNLNTYYSNARLDASVTKKINVYASWLYQYQRMAGAVLPTADSINGLFNIASHSPITNYNSGIGFTAPNQTINVGADFSITPRLVSTTRFGHFVQDYHDFGYPTGLTAYVFATSGIGATDSSGTPIPATSQLYQGAGFTNAAVDGNYTPHNLNSHDQFNEDVAWYKSGLWGTHNLKFGYQLNRLYNKTLQRSNLPEVIVFPGTSGGSWGATTQTGQTNCAALAKANGGCYGTDGIVYIFDIGTDGVASNYNHSLFVQDSWTIGKGVTLNLGLRAEKESLPAYQVYEGLTPYPVDFSWSDKIAPRLGAAWDVLRNGKLKAFGSYGVYYDTMKLNLAISSFGGQYWNNCAYGLNTQNLSAITAAFGADGRACEGLDPTKVGNLTGPTGALTFIENQNNRTPEYVQPGIKPYRQHNVALGIDYLLKKDLALEVRWDRRRLDRAIEDSAFANPVFGESYYIIVNPGFAPNNTFNSFALNAANLDDPLYGCINVGKCPSGANGILTQTVQSALCSTCPPPPKAIRNYDGVEVRVTQTMSKRLYAMVSYTYSSLWGNYTGLTSTDISDSGSLYGGGRASPNNSRYFDEPWFSYTANGASDAGPLATDRPNVFKGIAYYQLPEGGRNSTNIGLFQYFYQGSPLTSYLNVGFYYTGAGGQVDQYVAGRGNWISASQDQGCVAGALAGTSTASCPITVNGVSARRTPWYIQSDLQLQHEIKLGGSEMKRLRFEVTAPNVFNQKAVTTYNSELDSPLLTSFLAPGPCTATNAAGQTITGCTPANGATFYNAVLHPYDWKSLLNNPLSPGGAIIMGSNYGKPLYYQLPRTLRFGIRYTF
jgi:Carboxypeptidase regulatory-like domain